MSLHKWTSQISTVCKSLAVLQMCLHAQSTHAEGWLDTPISGGTEYHQVDSEQALASLVADLKANDRIIIDVEPYIPIECKGIVGTECIHYRALSTQNVSNLRWDVHAGLNGHKWEFDKAESAWRQSGHDGLRIVDLNVIPVKYSWRAKDKGGTEGLHYQSSSHVTLLMVENRENAEWYFFYDVDALKLDELRLDYGQEKDLLVTGYEGIRLSEYSLMTQTGNAPNFRDTNFVVYTQDVKGREHHFAANKSTPKQIQDRQSWGYRPYMYSNGRIGWIKDSTQKVVFGPEVTDEGSWHKGRIQTGFRIRTNRFGLVGILRNGRRTCWLGVVGFAK